MSTQSCKTSNCGSSRVCLRIGAMTSQLCLGCDTEADPVAAAAEAAEAEAEAGVFTSHRSRPCPVPQTTAQAMVASTTYAVNHAHVHAKKATTPVLSNATAIAAVYLMRALVRVVSSLSLMAAQPRGALCEEPLHSTRSSSFSTNPSNVGERETETERQTERDRETDRDRERESECVCV